MVSWTLMAAAVSALVAGGVFAFVGRQLRRRAVSNDVNLRALRFFIVWWEATAVNILLVGALYLGASLGLRSLPLQIADSVIQRILLAASLWGLMTYLVLVLTGREWSRFFGFLYGAVGAFMVAVIVASGPDGMVVGEWRTDLTYAREAAPWWSIVTLTTVVIPPILASAVYLTLFFRIPRAQREQRYRVLLVSTSLIAWWVVAVVAGQREAMGNEVFQIANRAVGLAAALLILVAYRPPAWIERRLHSEARSHGT